MCCFQNSRGSGMLQQLSFSVELLVAIFPADEVCCQFSVCTIEKYLVNWSLTLSARVKEVPCVWNIVDGWADIFATRNLNFCRSEPTTNNYCASVTGTCGAGETPNPCSKWGSETRRKEKILCSNLWSSLIHSFQIWRDAHATLLHTRRKTQFTLVIFSF